MKKEKWQIIDDIEEIQDRVNGMGFKGSNEIELWTRDLIADYIVNTLNIDSVVLPNDSEGTLCEHRDEDLIYKNDDVGLECKCGHREVY